MLADCAFSADRLPSEYRLIKRICRKRGVIKAIRIFVSLISVYVKQGFLLTVLKPSSTFRYSDEACKYLHHWRVTTFLDERTIEIPIVVREIEKKRPDKLLEIGNVLHHYVTLPHTVVDKYEVTDGVLNVDVVDFDPPQKFDMIVSISTLEHVGWDEAPKERDKTLRALRNLERLLNPKGRLVCTFPLGYNPYLDELLEDGKLPFTELRYLKRLNFKNEWCEVGWDQVKGVRYGQPFAHANAVVVGTLQK